MTKENKQEILNVINDKAFLEKSNITEKDIFKAIKLGLDEFNELQNMLDEEKSKGLSFDELCEKLQGQNEDFTKKESNYKYFDLHYKSIFVTVFENTENNKYEVEKASVHFYPDNIMNIPSTYLFILDITEPFDLFEFDEYMDSDIADVLLKNHYSKITDINKDTYMIAYVLEAGSGFGEKYIRKADMNDENLQKIFNEGKDMFNSVDCSKFKIVILNKNNNQFITSYSPDLSNFERKYNFKDICEDIIQSNTSDNITERIYIERLCNNQIKERCLLNKYNSLEEIPDIEQYTKINSSKRLNESEIFFQDGILIENGVINALLIMSKEEIEKKFGVKKLICDGEYYDVYLDYDTKKNSCEITIVGVTDDDRHYYTYLPTTEEQKILKESLEDYIKMIEGKSIQDLLVEEEEREQE